MIVTKNRKGECFSYLYRESRNGKVTRTVRMNGVLTAAVMFCALGFGLDDLMPRTAMALLLAGAVALLVDIRAQLRKDTKR